MFMLCVSYPGVIDLTRLRAELNLKVASEFATRLKAAGDLLQEHASAYYPLDLGGECANLR